MVTSTGTDLEREVQEAHDAFQRQVADALGQVQSLQYAVMELAMNHQLVAERVLVSEGPAIASVGSIEELPVALNGSCRDGGGRQRPPTLKGGSSEGVCQSRPELPHPPMSPLTRAKSPKPKPLLTAGGDWSQPPIISPLHTSGPKSRTPQGLLPTESQTQLVTVPTDFFAEEHKSELSSASSADEDLTQPPKTGKRRSSRGTGARLSGSYTGAANLLHQDRQLKTHDIFDSLCKGASLDRATRSASSELGSDGPDDENAIADVSGTHIGAVPWAVQPTLLCGRALHPHSTPMNLWEGLGSVALLIDSFSAPWFLAFYRKSEIVDTIIYWACLAAQVYWTVDIAVNTVKGYWTKDTVLELRLSAAVKRYLRSWCLFDVVLVAANWMFLSGVSPEGSDQPTSWHLSTSSHLYKVLLTSLWLHVLVNARKTAAVHESVKVYVLRWESHRGWNLLVDIVTILLVIFNLNHVLSCLWYAIGELDTDTGISWLSERSWSRQYFYASSLHWSISQMTPGSMEVVPRSTVERTYAVLVLMMGWVVATTLTGLVNSVMTGERLRIEERTKRFMLLQRYFLQENVEHSLAMTANMQVKARRQERMRVRLHDVQDLHYISKATREQLSVYIFGQKLKSNSFFRLVDVFSPDAFAVLCSQAVTSFTYLPAKAVFEEGAAGDKIIFVHYGKLKYTAGVDAYEYEWEKTDPRLTLQDRSWCSEAALWCQWTYLGSMQATEQSDCAAISAADLCKHIRKFKDVASMISEFSRSFLWVQRNANVKWSDLTVYIDHADIIAAMSRQARVLVGSTLLAPWQHLNRGWFSSGISEKKVQKLQDEISNGEGFVCLHDGEAVRTVFLVALRVSRNTDNKILVKLGQLEPTTCDVKAAAVLPGTKRREEETNWQATRRLVSKDLETLSKTMEVNFNEADVNASMQQSAYFGIRTRYLRTTYEAWVKFDEGFPMKSFDFKALRSSSQQYASPLAQVMTAVASKKSSITKAASTWHISKIPRSWRLQRGALPAMRVKSFTLRTPSSSSHIAEDILHSISELTIVPSSQGEGRHDVYVWLTERDYGTLQQSPEEVRKFLEVVWETEDWMSSGTLDRGDWHEEV
mmetsp:Transcript_32340/g.75974  ORF Transcript_32340/g.75974 Transcript_32340/m.75974 type:complete len:1099 (-) Transcript_32340:34-3330(-)